MFAHVLRTRLGAVSLALLAGILLLAIFGPLLAPYSAFDRTGPILALPSAEHLMGTDYLGRDILSRLLVGARLSVFAAFVVLGVAFVVGVIPALLSVYLGRVFEWLSLRIMDTLVTIPFLLFAIAVTQLIGNGVVQAMLVLGLMVSPSFFRVARAATIQVGRAQYVEAAYLSGATTWFVLGEHIWRKVVPAIAIASANTLSIGFVAIASLTFLGIGVQPPEPTWGGMIASDFGYLFQNPISPIFPSAMIIIAIGSLNALADALRDATGDGATSVRSKRRRAGRAGRRSGVFAAANPGASEAPEAAASAAGGSEADSATDAEPVLARRPV